jgi:peptidoglycan/LPS O-acetylase OafA/YrhL
LVIILTKEHPKITEMGPDELQHAKQTVPTTAPVKPDLGPLDGLRGIGAVCIVVYHFFGLMPPRNDLRRYPVYAPEFMSVVTLFFIISGFTLVAVYNKASAAPRPIPLAPFLIKRVARLVPVYYFSLLVALPVLLAYDSNDKQQLARCLATTLLWFQSVVIPPVGWNLPLWQVSAFAFLYLSFPSSLARLRPWTTRGLRRLIPWLMVINFVVVLIALQVVPLLGLPIAYLHRWAPFRWPQFIMGMAAGLLAQRAEAALARPTRTAEACSAVLFLNCFVLCPLAVRLSVALAGIGTWDVYSTCAEYVLAPVYAWWILGLTTPGCGGYTRRVLVSAPAKFLGEISYSLYCIHAPILYYSAWAVSGAVTPYRVAQNATQQAALFIVPAWAILIILPICVIAATALHYLVERPSRGFIGRLASERAAAPLADMENGMKGGQRGSSPSVDPAGDAGANGVQSESA